MPLLTEGFGEVAQLAELWSIEGIQLLNSLDRGSNPLLTYRQAQWIASGDTPYRRIRLVVSGVTGRGTTKGFPIFPFIDSRVRFPVLPDWLWL